MLRRLKNLVNELGAGTAILYCLHRLFAASRLPVSLYSYRLVVQPVSAEPHLTKTRLESFVCRKMGEGDLAFADAGLEPDLCSARFQQGAVCYGLFRNGTLCAWLWLVPGAYEEDEVRCRFELSQDMMWDFDVMVLPKFQMGFAFAALWDCVNTELSSQGINWCASRISAFNMPSRRSHQRLGAVDMGWMLFVAVGPVQVMLHRERPRFHLGIGNARPVVLLRAPQG